jgi:hypothetical protein
MTRMTINYLNKKLEGTGYAVEKGITRVYSLNLNGKFTGVCELSLDNLAGRITSLGIITNASLHA